jgi:hypothetical protein
LVGLAFGPPPKMPSQPSENFLVEPTRTTLIENSHLNLE